MKDCEIKIRYKEIIKNKICRVEFKKIPAWLAGIFKSVDVFFFGIRT